MAKLSKAHAMIIHDADVDKVIQNTINDQDLKNTTFFIATNRLPKERDSNVKILCMTGKKIKKSIFETIIYHGLYAMKEEYKAYCIDQLYQHLYWNNKYLSMEGEDE
jgi:hypothetical protein